LEKLIIRYTILENIENLNLSKCKNLYDLSISSNNINNINLEGCKNIEQIFISNNDLLSIKLPSFPNNESKLENLLLYNDSPKVNTINIFNLEDNKNITKIILHYDTYNNIDFNIFKKLTELDIRNNNFLLKSNKSLDISKNYYLKKGLELYNSKLSYIDFPYNFNTDSLYISDNIFTNKKIIKRRRIYLLCESKVGTPKGLVETPTKCFRCKKNILIYNKLNIREQYYEDPSELMQKYNYISCC